jgi:Ca2+/Na+ antiporter
MLEILVTQLTDPFRIGLIFFMFLTALRTRDTVGLAIPLVLGVVFVAVLLPMTTGANTALVREAPLWAIGFGVVSNAIILGTIVAGWAIWIKQRG